MPEIILASGSHVRKKLLTNAGLSFRAQPARIDEAAIKAALAAENATPRDIADALAEFKARKVAEKHPGAVVIGTDQVLEFQGGILSKPVSRDAASEQLRALRGQQHRLLSAVVVYEDAEPVWRHVGQVRLTMRDVSDGFLNAYLDRNWPGIGDSVGGYKLEEEGIRLFSRVEGDYFTVLGLPLLDLLGFLAQKGVIDG
ncbi:septum formation protein Maf [Rhodobacteraceae bacterium W635]|uniref:Maf family protein n=1 Tax=Nioella halotolerans TaxID=2303578 RepID=UPI000E3E1098|nr:septum formation protein Maf [Rhodobacteraceae bacterium W635]